MRRFLAALFRAVLILGVIGLGLLLFSSPENGANLLGWVLYYLWVLTCLVFASAQSVIITVILLTLAIYLYPRGGQRGGGGAPPHG